MLTSVFGMDNIFETIRSHCLAKPGAYEDSPWGETVFKVGKKIFTFAGNGQYTVKATLDRQTALIQHPDIEIARYVGRYGWVTIRISSQETLDLALDLIDESYASVAPRKRINGR